MSRNSNAAVQQHGGQREHGGPNHQHPLHHSSSGERLPQPRHGRVTGTTWRKRVRESRHMMRRPRGWALDKADVFAAWGSGVKKIALHELENGCTYHVGLLDLLHGGRTIDLGYGEQLFLPLERWQVSQNSESDSGQLTLFGCLP